MIPGGPRNAKQMQMMMRRLGMTTEAIDGVEEVIIRTRETEHVFKEPEVTIMVVQGTKTYQVVGSPVVRPRSAAPAAPSGTPSAPSPPAGPPEEDVALVMEQGNVEREEAIRALKEADGAPAEAIMKILMRRGPSGR